MCCDTQLSINSVTRLPECTRIRRLLGLRYFTQRLPGLGYLLSGRSRNGNSRGLLYFSHRLNGPDLGLNGNHPISQICDLLVSRSLKSAIFWSPPGLSNLRSLRKSPGLRDRLRGTEGRCYPFHVQRPCCSPVFRVSLTGNKGKCYPLFVHRPVFFWSSRPTVSHGFTDGHQKIVHIKIEGIAYNYTFEMYASKDFAGKPRQ